MTFRRRTLAAASLLAATLSPARGARAADNLVFVPLPPCRVIDTRVSGAGGKLVAGTPRSFVFRGPTTNYQNPTPFPNQGGNTAGCGVPDLTSDGGSEENIAKAVAINIVAVAPNGAGDLRAWPANQTAPTASVINYAAVTGLNLANGVIVPMCDEVSATPCSGGDITFRADVSGTYLVVDVVGYFHAGSRAATLTNTALGHQALVANTTGSANTAVGILALSSNTTGKGSTSTGAYSLLLNTTGSNNTANGFVALEYNTAGFSNTATGAYALNRNTTGGSNTATGLEALQDNTSGSFNTASGGYALSHNTTGSHNSATGTNALFSNTAGYSNTAVGSGALSSNTTGYKNTAVGFQSALLSSTGNWITAVGYKALFANTASGNTATGAYALQFNTSGAGNTAHGAYALRANTTGSNNTALGRGALSNSTSYNNTGVGANALYNNTTGSSNTAVGQGALALNNTGIRNTALGTGALGYGNGSYNTAVGTSAMFNINGGNDNTAMGSSALNAISSGSNNTAIGLDALVSNSTGNGNTTLGFESGLHVTGSYNTIIGFQGGNVLTTGSYNLSLDNPGIAGESNTIRIGSIHHTRAFMQGIRGITTGAANAVAVLIDSNGQLGTASSSRRFKEDIHDLGDLSDRLLELRPVSFRYKQPYADGTKPLQYGLIAEEVEDVFPELVAYGKDGQPETVKYHLVNALLLDLVQKQGKLIDELTRRLDALENR